LKPGYARSVRKVERKKKAVIWCQS
jgi:hypothetical protein